MPCSLFWVLEVCMCNHGERGGQSKLVEKKLILRSVGPQV